MTHSNRNAFLILAVLGVAGVITVALSHGDAPAPNPAMAGAAPVAPAVAAAVQVARQELPRIAPATLPSDAALLGASSVRSAPGVQPGIADLASTLTSRRDARIDRLYDILVDARRKAEPEPGAPQTARSKWNLGRMDVVRTLIEQDRFLYVGDPANAPRTRNTDHVRYVTTELDGLRMVLEVHRAEFPQMFDKPELELASGARRRRAQ